MSRLFGGKSPKWSHFLAVIVSLGNGNARESRRKKKFPQASNKDTQVPEMSMLLLFMSFEELGGGTSKNRYFHIPPFFVSFSVGKVSNKRSTIPRTKWLISPLCGSVQRLAVITDKDIRSVYRNSLLAARYGVLKLK